MLRMATKKKKKTQTKPKPKQKTKRLRVCEYRSGQHHDLSRKMMKGLRARPLWAQWKISENYTELSAQVSLLQRFSVTTLHQ